MDCFIWLSGHLTKEQWVHQPWIILEQFTEFHGKYTHASSVFELAMPPLRALGRPCFFQLPSAGNLDQLLGGNLLLCRIKCSLHILKLLYPRIHYLKHLQAQLLTVVSRKIQNNSYGLWIKSMVSSQTRGHGTQHKMQLPFGSGWAVAAPRLTMLSAFTLLNL